MAVSGYTRGIPTYKDAEGNEMGMLCETKEKCVTDESGFPLNRKLEDMQAQINAEAAKTDASTLEGHNAAYFATAASVTGIVDGTQKVGNSDKLDGQDSSYFASAESVSNIVNGTTKVGNADKLDGQDSAYFATAESVTNIVNGTTRVGDAQKLGGNAASSFATKTDLTKYIPAVVVATDPGVGSSTSYANGTLIFVKE